MAYNPKLLRVDSSGLGYKSAKVGLLNDATEEFRLAEIYPIEAHITDVYGWITARLTPAEIWDFAENLDDRPGLLEAWLSLYHYDDALANIADDIDECDANIAAIPLADLAALRTIMGQIVTRQKHVLNRQESLIKIMARIIRVLAPSAEEAPGE